LPVAAPDGILSVRARPEVLPMSFPPRWRAACSALGLLAVLGTTAPAGAQTLVDALARVYAENPQILAERARAEVVAHWDMATITRQLAETYREAVREKRATVAGPAPTVK
jgi:hypothetical protein